MATTKAIFVLIVIFTSLLSAVSAGGHRKIMDESGTKDGEIFKDQSQEKIPGNEGEGLVAHPRMLAVKTNDYGGYDPAPSVSKPRFKPIPN